MKLPCVEPHPTTAQLSPFLGCRSGKHTGRTYVLKTNGVSTSRIVISRSRMLVVGLNNGDFFLIKRI